MLPFHECLGNADTFVNHLTCLKILTITVAEEINQISLTRPNPGHSFGYLMRLWSTFFQL